VPPYLDTSALAKWYVPEARSDEFAEFMQSCGRASISRLTLLEMRSVLSRRRRERLIDAAEARRAWTAFRQDLLDGILELCAVADADFDNAVALLDRLAAHPLRSLDSLHLAIVLRLGFDSVVTADRTLAAAARALKLRVVWFGR